MSDKKQIYTILSANDATITLPDPSETEPGTSFILKNTGDKPIKVIVAKKPRINIYRRFLLWLKNLGGSNDLGN